MFHALHDYPVNNVRLIQQQDWNVTWWQRPQQDNHTVSRLLHAPCRRHLTSLSCYLIRERAQWHKEEVTPKWKFAFIVTSQICLRAFRIQNDQSNNWNRHERMRKETRFKHLVLTVLHTDSNLVVVGRTFCSSNMRICGVLNVVAIVIA